MNDVETIRKAVLLLKQRTEAATPGRWVVFDMDDAEKSKGDPLNDPGQGWYWVWAEERLPYYGGVMSPERHHPHCKGPIGSAAISDHAGGLQEQADAEYIAALHPDVARYLADTWALVATDCSPSSLVFKATLKAARAYLGIIREEQGDMP